MRRNKTRKPTKKATFSPIYKKALEEKTAEEHRDLLTESVVKIKEEDRRFHNSSWVIGEEEPECKFALVGESLKSTSYKKVIYGRVVAFQRLSDNSSTGSFTECFTGRSYEFYLRSNKLYSEEETYLIQSMLGGKFTPIIMVLDDKGYVAHVRNTLHTLHGDAINETT